LNYDNWVAGLKAGRSYCGDGMSHVVDFKINGFEVGTRATTESAASRLDLEAPQQVTVTFAAAALLEPEPTNETERIRGLRLDEKPYWHLERARIGQSRTVPVEVIVNGEVHSTHEMPADGELRTLSAAVQLDQSSWVAIRILPSVHTNPIFVHVDGQPIRANAKSAQWCIDAVKTCWESKQGMIRAEDREAAKQAYDEAAAIYEKVLAESR
jgi:hypothetical protein